MCTAMKPRPPLPPPASAALALALWASINPALAWAQDDLAERARSAVAEEASRRHSGVAPDSLTLRLREDAALFSSGASPALAHARYSEATGWLSPDKPSSIGLTLGVLSAGAVESSPAAPLAYDLGLRWRTRLEPRVHLDIQAWTRTSSRIATHDAMGMIWAREPAGVGTRLEVQWKASRTGGLIPEFGAIGVQLQGDARLLLRARHGGPMVYYRTRF